MYRLEPAAYTLKKAKRISIPIIFLPSILRIKNYTGYKKNLPTDYTLQRLTQIIWLYFRMMDQTVSTENQYQLLQCGLAN